MTQFPFLDYDTKYLTSGDNTYTTSWKALIVVGNFQSNLSSPANYSLEVFTVNNLAGGGNAWVEIMSGVSNSSGNLGAYMATSGQQFRWLVTADCRVRLYAFRVPDALL